MHPRLLFILVLSCLLPARVSCASPWTPEDLVRVERAEDFTISNDGDQVAWVHSKVVKVKEKERRIANLWLARLGDGEPVQLTRGVEDVSAPAFSSSARHLAFLSDRDFPGYQKAPEEGAKRQLWALATAGGEAFPLTRFERPVLSFGWIDTETLVVAVPEAPSAWHREREKLNDTAEVIDDAENEPPVRLYRVNLAKEVQRLTTNHDWIDGLAVSPDGRRALVRAQRSLSYEFDSKVPPVYRLVDLNNGASTPLFEGSKLLPNEVRWANDGSGFYFVNFYSRHPLYRTATISELYFHDLGSGTSQKLDLDTDRGLGAEYAVAQDGVLALLHGGVRYRPVRLQGSAVHPLQGKHVPQLDGWVLSRDGTTVVYRTSSATRPPQWYSARLAGMSLVDEQQLTHLNPGYGDKTTGRVEALTWKGARGDEVEGLVHYPLDWREGDGPRPLVLDIHGGPAGIDRDTWDQRWAAPIILYRQRGAFVLQVNYHGSEGYGLDWVESLEGHYYELEIPDIEAGVDLLISRGLADPKRLGSTGWSNGGILTADLITRTDRYRAASVGAADVEWFSDWANVDFGASFDNYYFGGPPWEIPGVYLEKSPFFRLTEVTTPTIVHTGTEDRAVPPHQSWSLFRALQQIGRTETRLVLYPGEPHGLRQVAHQRRKIEEDMAWFDRHLFGTHKPTRPEIPQGSRLDGLLKRSTAARHGGNFGVLEKGHLIPEVAPFKGLTVGRFEVTRAQWAAFEGSGPAPGEGDLPVRGITFERAQAYVDWLAKVTGRPFRLPSREEAEVLAEAGGAGDGGNTLDFWVGYGPNVDDTKKIRAGLEALERGPSLVQPVGRFGAVGEVGVFDLDGNVAEWAVGEEGGVAVGPSADRGAENLGLPAATVEYTGLRVVEGAAPQALAHPSHPG